jgi:hypothetical protein
VIEVISPRNKYHGRLVYLNYLLYPVLTIEKSATNILKSIFFLPLYTVGGNGKQFLKIFSKVLFNITFRYFSRRKGKFLYVANQQIYCFSSLTKYQLLHLTGCPLGQGNCFLKGTVSRDGYYFGKSL